MGIAEEDILKIALTLGMISMSFPCCHLILSMLLQSVKEYQRQSVTPGQTERLSASLTNIEL